MLPTDMGRSQLELEMAIHSVPCTYMLLFPPYLAACALQSYTDWSSPVGSKQGCRQRFPCQEEMSMEWSIKFKAWWMGCAAEGHTVTSKPRRTEEHQPVEMYEPKWWNVTACLALRPQRGLSISNIPRRVWSIVIIINASWDKDIFLPRAHMEPLYLRAVMTAAFCDNG